MRFFPIPPQSEGTLDFEFLNRVNDHEKIDIQNKHPGLTNQYFQCDEKNPEKPYKVVLGKGTFSKARLARAIIADDAYYFAVRKIKDEEELPLEDLKLSQEEDLSHSGDRADLNTSGDSDVHKSPKLTKQQAREQVAVMTEREIRIHHYIKEKIPTQNIALAIKVINKKNKNKQDQLYQIMPLADMGDGKRIIDLLKKYKLNKDSKKIFFTYISAILLNTVSTLHTNHCYLNDLKPENILFSTQGDIWLSDLGSAICFDENGKEILKTSGVSAGAYIHPALFEIIKAEQPVNRLLKGQIDDIWALAVTLLEFYDDKNKTAFFLKDLNESYGTTEYLTGSKRISYYNLIINKFLGSSAYLSMPEFVQQFLSYALKLDPLTHDTKHHHQALAKILNENEVSIPNKTIINEIFNELLNTYQNKSSGKERFFQRKLSEIENKNGGNTKEKKSKIETVPIDNGYL